VVMSGRLSIREEEAPKLLLDRVVPIRDLDMVGISEGVQSNSGTHYGDALSKRADNATEHTQEKAPVRKLYLKLRTAQREEVLKILCKTPGNICVMLHMSDEKKTYQAPKEYWVSDSYEKKALEDLLGVGNVVLK